MKNYRIYLEFQNPYIGQRNGGNRVIADGMTLKQAQARLLELYNEKFDHYAHTWGAAVRVSSNCYDGAQKTEKDGTRELRYDSRTYRIECDEL